MEQVLNYASGVLDEKQEKYEESTLLFSITLKFTTLLSFLFSIEQVI